MIKKIIGLCALVILLIGGLSFAQDLNEIQPVCKKGSMEGLFNRLGLYLNRDLSLLMEVNGLVDYKNTNLGWSKLYRVLKKFDFKQKIDGKLLPHKDCKPGNYAKLDHNFYASLGSVIPYYNHIYSYRLAQYPDQLFVVGSGDIDTTTDNCQNSTVGKDDKSAGCMRHMRHYFNQSEFEIVKCK